MTPMRSVALRCGRRPSAHVIGQRLTALSTPSQGQESHHGHGTPTAQPTSTPTAQPTSTPTAQPTSTSTPTAQPTSTPATFDGKVLFNCKTEGAKVASTSDGLHLFVICGSSSIYFSNTSGSSWFPSNVASTTSAGMPIAWESIACSGDGKVAIASTFNHGLFHSSDFGANWGNIPSDYHFKALTSSRDGSLLYGIDSYNNIFFSTFQGFSWSYLSTTPFLSGDDTYTGISCDFQCNIRGISASL